jgi:hypothetical protein
MKNFINLLTVGAGALLLFSACSTSYNAMRGGNDDLYFSASDARIATEFAVNNNNARNFQSLNNVNQETFEQENFSARNVNPEYIARYQNQSSQVEDDGTVYFDEAGAGNDPNINVYNNFVVGNNGFNNRGFNPMFNMGFGMGSMWGMGMPMWGMPMWGMGMMDPFWGMGMPMMGMPMWGMGMPMWGMGPGFRMGFGWNSMMGFNMGMGMGFGWGGRGMWGNHWMNPWMDPFMMGMGGFGWNRPIFVVNNNNFGENSRRVVRGATPSRSSMAPGYAAARRGDVLPANSRAARRDATSTSGRAAASPTSRTAARDFSSSQNEYYNTRSRIGNSTAGTSSRNTSSAAATRPTRSGGVNSVNPSNTNRVSNPYTSGSRNNAGFSNRSAAPQNRAVNPSYNRGNNNMGTPSRSMQSTPSRGSGVSTFPGSRTSSPSMGTPSRGGMSGGSVGGGSVGGASRGGGGGGASVGGSRGGRGN